LKERINILIMPKYFQDNRFYLLYYYDEDMYYIDDVPNMVYSEETGESLVISARGNGLSDGRQILDNGKFFPKVENDPDRYSKAFSNMNHLNDEELELVFGDMKEKEIVQTMRDIRRLGNSKFVSKLMILAYSDGNEKELPDFPDLIKIKVGGTEIVAEYMLSEFCSEFKKVSPINTNNENLDKRIKWNSDDTRYWNYEFNFDLSENLSELDEIDNSNTEIDMDGTVWDGSFKRYRFNINDKAVNSLFEEFKIPGRVYDVLTKEQLMQLKEQFPLLLQEKMDFIGLQVFKQKFDSLDAHHRLMESRVASENWRSSMRQILGEDGSYLGDGISLNDED
jgi:hypothetical protein